MMGLPHADAQTKKVLDKTNDLLGIVCELIWFSPASKSDLLTVSQALARECRAAEEGGGN